MKSVDYKASLLKKTASAAFLFLMVFCAFPVKAQECSRLLEQGDEYYAQFDNRQALEYYRRAHQQCPESFEAITKTGQLLNDMGLQLTGDSAVEYYRRALRLSDTIIAQFPDSAQSYFFRAYSAGNLARVSSGREKVRLSRLVVENAEKSIALDSTYSRPYVVLGGYYREVATANSFLKFLARMIYGSVPDGTLEDSEASLLQALRLNPENIYAHFELGKTYLEMDRPEDAQKHLERVLKLPVQNYYGQVMKQKSREMLEDMN
ncbi:MAG: tetratricopeptide repeat protein [Chitinispirillaceae bacterium]